jgi:hypothetical protein
MAPVGAEDTVPLLSQILLCEGLTPFTQCDVFGNS